MAVPIKIGNYENIQKLGETDLSDVFLADDPATKRKVVIKRLKDKKLLKHFWREAKILAALGKAPIVPIFAYDDRDEQPYIVMRYMAGGSLEDKIKEQGPLPLGQIIQIIDRVADALNIAHKEKIIHRDLKPGNILFDENENAFLSDFGFTKQLSILHPTTTKEIVGTLRYASPEQLQDPGSIDNRTDIYSLGMILYEMLTGKYPFINQNIDPLIKDINEVVPQLTTDELKNAKLPPECNQILKKAMAKDRNKRYETASDLARDIAQLKNSTITAPYKHLNSASTLTVSTYWLARSLDGRFYRGVANQSQFSNLLWFSQAIILSAFMIFGVAIFATLGSNLSKIIMPFITQTLTPTVTVKTSYYMFVLDASSNMAVPFGNSAQTKWDATIISINDILNSLDDKNNYGLIVIGGQGENIASDPCTLPTAPNIPFYSTGTLQPSFNLSKQNILTHINQLKPSGGGSIYKAFLLAKFELENLPPNSTKTLIYLTSGGDNCATEDEWTDLKRSFELLNEDILTEIIIMPDNTNSAIEEFKSELLSQPNADIHVQVPVNPHELNESINETIDLLEAQIQTTSATPSAVQTLQAVIDKVNEQFQNTLKANIAFSAPKTMKLDDTAPIELLINPVQSQEELVTQIIEQSGLITATARPNEISTPNVTVTPELVTNQGQEMEIRTSEIQITNNMKAVLKSQDPNAFVIQDMHDNPIQPISSITSTKWRWSVTAQKKGTQTLELIIYQLIMQGEQEYWTEVESYKAEIKVKITLEDWLKNLDWYWFVGTLLIPLFLWLLNNKKKPKITNTPIGKYSPLADHLKKIPDSDKSIILSFDEIEHIIGDKLPKSAHQHSAWWRNEVNGRHVQSHSWTYSGWQVDNVDFSKRQVRFVRRGQNSLIDS